MTTPEEKMRTTIQSLKLQDDFEWSNSDKQLFSDIGELSEWGMRAGDGRYLDQRLINDLYFFMKKFSPLTKKQWIDMQSVFAMARCSTDSEGDIAFVRSVEEWWDARFPKDGKVVHKSETLKALILNKDLPLEVREVALKELVEQLTNAR